jgi:GNAT superfamily N-acetyltransferase
MAKTVTISVPKAVTLALVSFNSTLFASAVRTLLEQDGPHDGRLSQRTLNFYRQLAGLRPGKRDAGHPEGQSVRNGNGRVYAVVASEGNTILGFGGFAVINGQTDFETFVVAKAVRSSDLGTSIVQALVEEARKLTGVQLGSVEVGASNPFALRALVKAGFLPTDSGNTKTRGGNVNTIVLSLPEA